MNTEQFQEKQAELKAMGFEPMMVHVDGWRTSDGESPSIPLSKMWEVGDDMAAGSVSQQESVTLDYVSNDVGTPKLGVVRWGKHNDMPQRIDSLVNALPYTAQGINYLHDVVMGLGPQMQWHTAIYDTNTGKVNEVTMPYQHAGTWLKGRIAALSSDTSVDHADEIADLKEQLKEWNACKPVIDDFLKENDVLDWMDRLVMDYVKMGICFPTLLLSLGRCKDDNGNVAPWHPTVKRVDRIADIVARMEQKDKKLHINYIYHAEKWRQNGDTKIEQGDAVAYPTLWPKNILTRYRGVVRDAEYVEPKKRPTKFCAPITYCDNINGYYPWMPWWSIFTSKAYYMASSYMYDKATARNNANMWGKMVFINNEYLRALYSARGADTTDEQQTIRKEVWDNINRFLKDKANNQKTICLDSIPGPDGKTMMKSIEVVDVPGLSESTDMKEALEEITSVIFFGLGVKSGLIGDIPGKTTSNSGTYQRELTLLKQNQMAPVQQKFLRLLDTISEINGWNTDHFKWVIRQQVLTTLDRNPEGKVEQNVH